MTYDDFMKILDDTQSMIISKDLFKTLLDSQIPDRITAEEKKRIYDDGYNIGYKQALFDNVDKPDKPIEDMLTSIKAEIYEEFATIDAGVQDKSAIKCMQIIDKHGLEE